MVSEIKYISENPEINEALFNLSMLLYLDAEPAPEYLEQMKKDFELIKKELYKCGLLKKIINSEHELEEKKNWYHQLKLLKTIKNFECGETINSYTNYMNIYHYVYDKNEELIRIEVEKYKD